MIVCFRCGLTSLCTYLSRSGNIRASNRELKTFSAKWPNAPKLFLLLESYVLCCRWRTQPILSSAWKTAFSTCGYDIRNMRCKCALPARGLICARTSESNFVYLLLATIIAELLLFYVIECFLFCSPSCMIWQEEHDYSYVKLYKLKRLMY